MNNTYFTLICLAIMVINAFLSAFSQILLKKSTLVVHKSGLQEYLNWRVITAYVIYIIVLLTNAFAYKGIEYKYGSIIGATSYIFLMVLSWLILKERINKRVIIGNGMIILGMIVYSSNLI